MFRMFSDLPAFRRDPLDFMLSRGCAAESMTQINVGFSPVFLVSDPVLMRQVLTADEAAIDKGKFVYKLREIIGNSSLVISGPDHRKRRSIIHKTLAEGLSGDYVPQIGSVIRSWVAALALEKEIDAHKVTAPLALRVICTILFGRDALSKGDEAALVEAVHLIEDDLAEEMFRALPHTPWAYARKKRKLNEARKIMSLVVERTRKRATAVSLLKALEDLGLEGDVLRDEVLLLLLAGHHTTGTAAAWLLYHLAADPQLAGSIAAETLALSDRSGELTPLAIRSASRSRALVQEILRLYPSTYWTSRELKHDQEVGGRQLKRGTSLIISPWHLHRDPRYWDQPDQLDLNRSWTANKAYIPFGFGGRACVGLNVALLEMQLIALEFATAFEAVPVSDQAPAAPKPSVTLVPPSIKLRLGFRESQGSHARAAA